MKSLEIANTFILRHGEGLGLTNLKLNKLVYYAQVESIRENGSPLFDDAVEAWQYGPVEPAVYREFKRFGRSAVRPEPSARPVLGRAADIVDRVAATYGRLSAFDLVSFSHRPGSAWSIVYDPRRDREITVRDIMGSDDIKGFPGFGGSVESAMSSFAGSIPNAMRLLENA